MSERVFKGAAAAGLLGASATALLLLTPVGGSSS